MFGGKEQIWAKAFCESVIHKDGRRFYKGNPFAHFTWNLYHYNDKIVGGSGYLIHHKDDKIWNLEKMTRSEHMFWHANHRSIETYQNISKSNKGKKRTEQHKKNYSAAKKGIPKSEEHKNNISKASKGKSKSEEHKNNMSKSRIGKNQSKEHIRKAAEGKYKPVIANFIEYNSLKTAAKDLEVSATTISNRIKTKKPGYSYK